MKLPKYIIQNPRCIKCGKVITLQTSPQVVFKDFVCSSCDPAPVAELADATDVNNEGSSPPGVMMTEKQKIKKKITELVNYFMSSKASDADWRLFEERFLLVLQHKQKVSKDELNRV